MNAVLALPRTLYSEYLVWYFPVGFEYCTTATYQYSKISRATFGTVLGTGGLSVLVLCDTSTVVLLSQTR